LKSQPPWFYVVIAIIFIVLVGIWSGVWQPKVSVPDEKSDMLQVPSVVYEEFSKDSRQESLPAEKKVEPKTIPATGQGKKGLAIILDDAGYNLSAVKRVLALPFPVAISILPSSPFAKNAAELTKKADRIVMLHLPMEPESRHYARSDDFLLEEMEKDEFETRVLHELDLVPYIEGVNNHMGSRLTSMRKPMAWLMELLHDRSLFFVDSRTSKDTVAAEEAKLAGLPWAERKVFLDHHPEPEAIKAAWLGAMQCYRKLGSCIIIAHPNAETLTFLENGITGPDQDAIVPVTNLLQQVQIK